MDDPIDVVQIKLMFQAVNAAILEVIVESFDF